MEKELFAQKEKLASSYNKVSYVVPECLVFCLQNEGVLCSSNPTGSADDPQYGGNFGFLNSNSKNKIWE